MNKILIALVVILVGLGLIWFARPQAQTNDPVIPSVPGSISATETAFDFGSISMAAGKVSHQFTVRNSGVGVVTINKIYTSCMCTSAKLITEKGSFGPFGMVGHGFIPSINRPLLPGEEAKVDVVFDPAAHGPAGVGKIERMVTIENDAGELVELRFSAVVTP